MGLDPVSWALIASAATSAGASVYNSSKAISAQKDAAKTSQVNIDALNNQTKAISTQNAIDSANLEKQLNPLAPELRRQSLQGLIAQLNPDQTAQTSQSLLASGLGQPLNTPLLTAAIAKAHSDLAMGGQLSPELQNLATRQGLAQAGNVAGNGGGLGLGRDLVARDLGLSSYGIEQQRLNTALGAGGQELGLATDNQTNLLNYIQLLNQMRQQQFSNVFNTAQFGQNIQQPNLGLSPSSIANISVGNSNAQGASLANQGNIYGQQSQNYLNLAGQLGGYGLLAYNQSQGSGIGQPTTYADFLKNNPQSSAAIGQSRTPGQ